MNTLDDSSMENCDTSVKQRQSSYHRSCDGKEQIAKHTMIHSMVYKFKKRKQKIPTFCRSYNNPKIINNPPLEGYNILYIMKISIYLNYQ